MRAHVIRTVFATCSALLLFGAIAHARAFPGAAAALSDARMPERYAADFRVLWLADSATLLIVAIVLAMLAVRPAAASRSVTIAVAAVPAATAALLYTFVGNFYAGHLLLGTAAAAAFAAAFRDRRAAVECSSATAD